MACWIRIGALVGRPARVALAAAALAAALACSHLIVPPSDPVTYQESKALMEKTMAFYDTLSGAHLRIDLLVEIDAGFARLAARERAKGKGNAATARQVERIRAAVNRDVNRWRINRDAVLGILPELKRQTAELFEILIETECETKRGGDRACPS